MLYDGYGNQFIGGEHVKKINANEVVWLGILVAFAGYIYYLFHTDKISFYIHPKMQNYVFMAMIIFGILAIVQVGQIFNEKRSNDIRLGNFMFIIPLLLVAAVDPTEMDIKTLSNKGIVIDHYYGEQEIQIHAHNTPEAQKFKYVLENIDRDIEVMTDKEVELVGFIYKGAGCTENQFVLSRLVMSCCAADSWIQGIRCEWEGSSYVVENQWVKVKATVKNIPSYNKKTGEIESIPLLKIRHISPVEAPVDPYIYY